MFMNQAEPSIKYLELYAIMTGVLLWLDRFPNWTVVLFCDNQSVVHMINGSASSCKNYMVLIRLIILQSMKVNTVVKARFIRSKENSKADTISRHKFNLYHKLANFKSSKLPEKVPDLLWPMHKIWMK